MASVDLNNCGDLVPEVGITATPVIDLAGGTIYVAAKTKESGNYFHKLHALDLLTGQEKFGGPAVVQGFVLGSGAGSVGGTNTFDALHANNRSGLLLLSNVVYLCYAGHCDWPPYHGWLFGYNATNLQRTCIFNSTPDGSDGGIWLSGMGPATDENGDIYLATGNGTFDKDTGGRDLGDSCLKLTPSNGTVNVTSWFAPHDQATLNADGPGSRFGRPDAAAEHQPFRQHRQIRQYLPARPHQTRRLRQLHQRHEHRPGVPTSDQQADRRAKPCLLERADEPVHLYVVRLPRPRRLQVYRGKYPNQPSCQRPPWRKANPPAACHSPPTAASPAAPSCGARTTAAAARCARTKRSNVAHELWNSQQNAARDALGSYVKFCAPTIANGKVYVSTSASNLVVYGLLTPPYQLWQQANFTPTELADPAISGDTADPDGDGIPNLAEYAFNTNPKTADLSGLPVMGTVNVGGSDYLALSYLQVLFNTDITCTVQVSGDLTTWNSGPGFTAVVSTVDNGDGTETITVRDTTPISSATKRFIRVHISRP